MSKILSCDNCECEAEFEKHNRDWMYRDYCDSCAAEVGEAEACGVYLGD